MRNLPEGVYLRRGSRLWIRYAVRGRKYREPVETTDPREAARLRRRRIEQHERGERTRHSETLRVADVLQAVLRDYELNDRRSIATARSYLAALAAARLGDGRGLLGQRLAIEVTTDDVEALQLRWQRAGLTNATINRRCNLLRRGFRLMVRAKKLYVVPYIPRLKDRSPRGRYITPADLARIQAHLPTHLRALVAFAYDDGIRKGQLARTRRRFVDLSRGVIEWPAEECKRDRPHVVPLEPGGTLDVVTRLMAEGRTRLWCPYLFHGASCAAGRRPSKSYGCVGDFKKAWVTACERAGFPVGRKHGGFVFHHTRNSAVTNLVAAGVAEGDAMKVTGHQTAHVFRHYDLGDVEALRARLAQRQAYVAAQPTQATVARLTARRRT
jgi:integrase